MNVFLKSLNKVMLFEDTACTAHTVSETKPSDEGLVRLLLLSCSSHTVLVRVMNIVWESLAINQYSQLFRCEDA